MIEIESTGVPIERWNGCGNAFQILDLRGRSAKIVSGTIARAPDLARRAAAPERGAGVDGLVLMLDEPGADVRTAMWNPDGSRGAICGNALRCITHWIADERAAATVALEMVSDVGRHPARARRDGQGHWHAEVRLGRASFDAESLPLDTGHGSVVAQSAGGPWRVAVDLDSERREGLALSVGNPHLIVPLEGPPTDVDVVRHGASLERSAAFPDRVNVSFVQVVSPTELRQRTFERGAGETLACGSGACASVVALTTTGTLERGAQVTVHMAGGDLGVTWTRDGELWLSGATERETPPPQ
ncbi:diaminopimelate epimerase [Engelhardtia mirabilis]|uniref:diaminopimelate epimerase n=1 Tax=Engelhardtia mirabilis TaxID=2528011 RepID=UPI003AF356E3